MKKLTNSNHSHDHSFKYLQEIRALPQSQISSPAARRIEAATSGLLKKRTVRGIHRLSDKIMSSRRILDHHLLHGKRNSRILQTIQVRTRDIPPRRIRTGTMESPVAMGPQSSAGPLNLRIVAVIIEDLLRGRHVDFQSVVRDPKPGEVIPAECTDERMSLGDDERAAEEQPRHATFQSVALPCLDVQPADCFVGGQAAVGMDHDYHVLTCVGGALDLGADLDDVGGEICVVSFWSNRRKIDFVCFVVCRFEAGDDLVETLGAVPSAWDEEYGC